MSKHFRHHELDDEQRALIAAVRALDDDDYDAHYARNMANTSYGQEWGRLKANKRCETCNRFGPREDNGYCFACRPETYEAN